MKAITFTIVTKKAQSLNYGETMGNVSTLKKLTIGDNKRLITYVSDKALKYDIKRIGRDTFHWALMDQTIVDVIKSCVNIIEEKKKEKKELTGEFNYYKFYEKMVKKYVEFDLFGGMFADIGNVYDDTKSKIIKINGQEVKVDIETTKLQRTAPVRITNAYSVSEFVYDSNLLNDIDAYNRYIQYTAGEKKQTLAYSDEHKSHYAYSILIDLEQVGCIKDGNGNWKQVKTSQEKINTIIQLLDILFFKLHRNIRGRIENLTPIFVIGGIFSYKHPIFHNSLDIKEINEKLQIGNINQSLENLRLILSSDKKSENKNKIYLFSDNELVEIKDNLKDNLEDIKPKNLRDIFEEIKKSMEAIWKD